MSIEAKVHAPTAGRTERAVVFGSASILVALGLIATNAFPIASTLVYSGIWLSLVGPFLLHHRRPRPAIIDAAAGRIRIHSKRLPLRTVRTRALVGASVARTDDGAVITLCERGSPTPIAIEVKSASDANAIRSSLGIPHAGFGQLSWTVQPRMVDVVLGLSRASGGLLLFVKLLATFAGAAAVSNALTVPVSLTVLATVLFYGAHVFSPSRALRMEPTSVHVTQDGATERLYYGDIAEITDDKTALIFRQNDAARRVVPCVPTTWLPDGMRADDRALMLAQLRGAVSVANGEAAPFVDPTSNLDALKRNHASAADWLARLDALAATHENAAYRATAIAKEDLWRALESHDAATDVRAGAARVLLRVSPEKDQERIARVLDSIHDDDERAHIRAALRDDVEEAAAEIEAATRR